LIGLGGKLVAAAVAVDVMEIIYKSSLIKILFGGLFVLVKF